MSDLPPLPNSILEPLLNYALTTQQQQARESAVSAIEYRYQLSLALDQLESKVRHLEFVLSGENDGEEEDGGRIAKNDGDPILVIGDGAKSIEEMAQGSAKSQSKS